MKDTIVECRKAGTGELCDRNCPLFDKCWLKDEVEDTGKDIQTV